MIRQLLAVPCFGLLVSLSFAQETAHLVEPTLPAVPAKPLPKLEVAPQDILSTKVKDLGDRQLIIQEIAPVDLPQPPEQPAPVEMTAERRAAFEARRLQLKQRRNLFLSATVYRSARYEGKSRTLLCWWSSDHQRQFRAWSNVDAMWLTGFANFQTPTAFYSLFMMPSVMDIDRWEALMLRRGFQFKVPVVPELPQAENSFVVVNGNPSAEELAPIEAIHNLFKTEGEKMHLAYEKRISAQREQEEFLKANPPKPEDVVIRYWRIQKPVAAAAPEEGGAQ